MISQRGAKIFSNHTFTWWLLSWLLAANQLWAQTGVDDRAKEIQRALQRDDYQIAIDLADSAIARFEDFTPAQLAEIHALRALIAFERDERAAADAHFKSALQLAPDFQLDPLFFSPAMQARFEQLRARLPKTETPTRVETRYVMLPDPRLQAAWKSLVLPGWGQRSKGQNDKGRLFTISAATLAAAILATHVLRQRAEGDYLGATDEKIIAQRYDTFNRYHQWRNNLALGLSIVWGAAILDALIFPARPSTPAVGLAPATGLNDPPLRISLQIQF
jgi:tetratricopeptide (TPR) repeat protein